MVECTAADSPKAWSLRSRRAARSSQVALSVKGSSRSWSRPDHTGVESRYSIVRTLFSRRSLRQLAGSVRALFGSVCWCQGARIDITVSGIAARFGESHLHVHAMLSTCWQQDVNLRVSTRRTPTSGTNGRPESALPQTAKFDPRRDERTSNIPRLRLTAFAASRSPRDK